MDNLFAEVNSEVCPYDPEVFCVNAADFVDNHKICEICLTRKVKRLRKELIHLRMNMREKGEL